MTYFNFQILDILLEQPLYCINYYYYSNVYFKSSLSEEDGYILHKLEQNEAHFC